MSCVGTIPKHPTKTPSCAGNYLQAVLVGQWEGGLGQSESHPQSSPSSRPLWVDQRDTLPLGRGQTHLRASHVLLPTPVHMCREWEGALLEGENWRSIWKQTSVVHLLLPTTGPYLEGTRSRGRTVLLRGKPVKSTEYKKDTSYEWQRHNLSTNFCAWNTTGQCMRKQYQQQNIYTSLASVSGAWLTLLTKGALAEITNQRFSLYFKENLWLVISERTLSDATQPDKPL